MPAATIASAGLAEVRDVVERVVQTEDVDPVLGGGRDEAAHEVGADGARADEEAAAQRQPERRRRARLQRADPLPRALDAAADGRVEDAAAGDLQDAKPAASSTSAIRSSSPVGTRPASGSCDSRRIVVSMSRGTCGDYRVRRADFVFQKHKASLDRVTMRGQAGLCFRNTRRSHSGEQGAPSAPHARQQGQLEAAVEDLKLRVADQIDHVEVLELTEDPADELAADALALATRGGPRAAG